MLIAYHGHSEFLLRTDAGHRILTDPYSPEMTGYPAKEVEADVVCMSHGHEDHAWLQKVKGSPVALSAAGVHTPKGGVVIRSMAAFHDEAQGEKRGQTLLTRIEADNLTIAHLGDVGCALTPEQADFLRGVDILMIPVGGFFTIGPEEAADMCALLKPRIVIPMHYLNEKGGFARIQEVGPFLDAMLPVKPVSMPLVRVTKGDLSEQPPLIVLDIR